MLFRLLHCVLCVALAGSAAWGQTCAGAWKYGPDQGIAGLTGIANAMMTWDPDGAGPLPERLIVAGAYALAGDQNAGDIAAWDGATWSSFGTGLNGPAYALASFNGDLVAGVVHDGWGCERGRRGEVERDDLTGDGRWATQRDGAGAGGVQRRGGCGGAGQYGEPCVSVGWGGVAGAGRGRGELNGAAGAEYQRFCVLSDAVCDGVPVKGAEWPGFLSRCDSASELLEGALVRRGRAGGCSIRRRGRCRAGRGGCGPRGRGVDRSGRGRWQRGRRWMGSRRFGW